MRHGLGWLSCQATPCSCRCFRFWPGVSHVGHHHDRASAWSRAACALTCHGIFLRALVPFWVRNVFDSSYHVLSFSALGHLGPSAGHAACSSRRSTSSSCRPSDLRTNQFQSLATRHLCHVGGSLVLQPSYQQVPSGSRNHHAAWSPWRNGATRLETGNYPPGLSPDRLQSSCSNRIHHDLPIHWHPKTRPAPQLLAPSQPRHCP